MVDSFGNSWSTRSGSRLPTVLLLLVVNFLFSISHLSTANRTREGNTTSQRKEGDLVLLGGGGGGGGRRGGGDAGARGNVHIYHNGQLWSVCDDQWNANAALVVCRSLGFVTASSFTTQSYFGEPEYETGLDDVKCFGNETTLLDCEHSSFGVHNCDKREAAGVICNSSASASSSSTASPITRTTFAATSSRRKSKTTRRIDEDRMFMESNELFIEAMQLDQPNPTGGRHKPSAYTLRVAGGRTSSEGRVEVEIDGNRGAICSDRWTMLEARVACKQAGLGLAIMPVNTSQFGGENLMKLAAGIECDGDELNLSDCYHQQSGHGTSCPSSNLVAGIICSTRLPDLVPNATLLEKSTYLQDQSMYYMQCAMEENCAASSAFRIKATNRDWHIFRRRLLRFSSSTWNFGTAPFLPNSRKETWEWHLCHMHYHSMSTFAQYDILDLNGNRVAEGHKASFCLEDVRCMPGIKKKYSCTGFGDQGITPGCADDYLHDIDCQWIDVTDVRPGSYIFKVKVNPEYLVGELDYNNNAAICNLRYTGTNVEVSGCVLGRG